MTKQLRGDDVILGQPETGISYIVVATYYENMLSSCVVKPDGVKGSQIISQAHKTYGSDNHRDLSHFYRSKLRGKALVDSDE